MLLQCYYIVNTNTFNYLYEMITLEDIIKWNCGNSLCVSKQRDPSSQHNPTYSNINIWNKMLKISKYDEYMKYYTFKLQDLIFNNKTEYELFYKKIITMKDSNDGDTIDKKTILINEFNKIIYCVDSNMPLYC